MVKHLSEHKLGFRLSGDDDPVFASKSGRPLAHLNATGEASTVPRRTPG